MRTSRFFSLLEIMVGLALVLMASGAISWKMLGFVEKKRFRVDLEQLKSRILTTHRMAVNMQADWEGTLIQDGKKWTFEAICLDSPQQKFFSPLQLHFSEVFFDGKKQGRFTFMFFSSGEIWPSGTLQFRISKDGKPENWDLPALFGKSGGSGDKMLGPVHPNEA